MLKKAFILTASMLFSANLLCDIKVANESPDTTIVFVEGITKVIPAGRSETFKVTIKDGKTLDGIPFAKEDTMVKWVRLVGLSPVVYRTKQIGKPSSMAIKPEGGEHQVEYWTGLLGERKQYGDVAVDITDKYENQMRLFLDKLRDAININFREKGYAEKAKNMKTQLDNLYFDLAKTEVK